MKKTDSDFLSRKNSIDENNNNEEIIENDNIDNKINEVNRETSEIGVNTDILDANVLQEILFSLDKDFIIINKGKNIQIKYNINII